MRGSVCLAFAAFLLAAPAMAQQQVVKIVSVGDGDTVTAMAGTKKVTLRLACIDAPEMKQSPWGEQSRKRLQQIIPNGSSVGIKTYTTDRYGRIVAEIFKGKVNVNLAMVQEGRAVAYREYLEQCDAQAYLRNENSAKQRRLAYWSQNNPVMPWDFRKGSTVARPQPPSSPGASKQCDPNYSGACIPDFNVVGDVNCSGISAKRFRSIGSDPHRLDGDGDGIACES